MRKIVTAGLVLAGLVGSVLVGSVLVGATSVAYAQTVPSCAEALRAQSDAQTADTAARKADQDAAAADTKADAAEAVDARAAAAVQVATRAGFPPADQTREQLTRLLGIAAAGDSDTQDGQTDAQENAEAAPKISALRAVFEAKAEADKTDAAALRTLAHGAQLEADKTDAAATGRALVLARSAANKACDPAPTPGATPAPVTTTVRAPVPAPAASFTQVDEVPSGSIDTGRA